MFDHDVIDVVFRGAKYFANCLMMKYQKAHKTMCIIIILCWQSLMDCHLMSLLS